MAKYYYYKKKLGVHKKTGPKPNKNNTYKYFLTNVVALYKNIYDFKKTNEELYDLYLSKGWIDKHYPYICKYTKKECKEMCINIPYSDKLKESNIGLYECIVRHNWFNEIFPYKKERFSEVNCYNTALKYKTYKDFRNGDNVIYTYCIKTKLILNYTWLKDDRIFMYKDKIDCVYMYKFEELHSVYIGRTLMRRIKERHNEHIRSRDSVIKYCNAHNVECPEMIILEDNLTLDEGLYKEHEYIEYYKMQGYNIINKAATGIGIGSIGILRSKWSRKKCFDAALTCAQRFEFEKRFPSAYRNSRRYGWLDDYTWFKEKAKHNYWNYDTCKEAALSCHNKNEFMKKYKRAYFLSLRNNWDEEFFPRLYKKNKNTKYMKIYKIDISDMHIVDVYNKVSDIIDSSTSIYRVLKGEVNVYKDGFMYRREKDIEIEEKTNTIIDKLHVKSKKDKDYIKYSFVIDLISKGNLKISEICLLSNQYGIKISEPTCRKLKERYG